MVWRTRKPHTHTYNTMPFRFSYCVWISNCRSRMDGVLLACWLAVRRLATTTYVVLVGKKNLPRFLAIRIEKRGRRFYCTYALVVLTRLGTSAAVSLSEFRPSLSPVSPFGCSHGSQSPLTPLPSPQLPRCWTRSLALLGRPFSWESLFIRNYRPLLC